jgi:hypothetical protein
MCGLRYIIKIFWKKRNLAMCNIGKMRTVGAHWKPLFTERLRANMGSKFFDELELSNNK